MAKGESSGCYGGGQIGAAAAHSPAAGDRVAHLHPGPELCLLQPGQRPAHCGRGLLAALGSFDAASIGVNFHPHF